MSEQEHEQVVVAYFDGLCEPANPGGYGCGGYVIEPFEHALKGLKGGKPFGNGPGMTNNVAEYEAALLVLREIYKTGYRGAVLLKGDSQLLVKQYNGQFACNSLLLTPLLEKLKKAKEHFESLTIVWIPREQNEHADKESQRIYTETTGRKVIPRPRKK